jgi:hypothetical protein
LAKDRSKAYQVRVSKILSLLPNNSNATIINKFANKVQWEAEISPQSLNREKTTIKAWVYDREDKQFIKLNGEIKLRISKK